MLYTCTITDSPDILYYPCVLSGSETESSRNGKPASRAVEYSAAMSQRPLQLVAVDMDMKYSQAGEWSERWVAFQANGTLCHFVGCSEVGRPMPVIVAKPFAGL